MKIAILNTTEKRGGAGIATHRFFKELSKYNDVKFFVKEKVSDNSNVVYANGTGFRKILSKINKLLNRLPQLLLKTDNKVLHSTGIFYSSFDINTLKEFDPDVIHMHWVAGGFLSIKDIINIVKLGKPVVWTLHDMWTFCGAEHYTMGDDRYTKGYIRNNRPVHESGVDINRIVWNYKMKYKEYFEKITYITPSTWLATCAKQSRLLKNADIKIIHNGLNPQVFDPIDKLQARKSLNLPLDKKIILFGALNATADPRKGYKELCEGLSSFENIAEIKNIELVVFGGNDKNIISHNISTTYLGNITDVDMLVNTYSAADLFIAPSLEDNLPNTVVESLSCATPVVAFDIGGMPDMISHKKNGYMVSVGDSDAMADGIVWCLDNISTLSKHAREVFTHKFDITNQSQKYKNLYHNLIKK